MKITLPTQCLQSFKKIIQNLTKKQLLKRQIKNKKSATYLINDKNLQTFIPYLDLYNYIISIPISLIINYSRHLNLPSKCFYCSISPSKISSTSSDSYNLMKNKIIILKQFTDNLIIKNLKITNTSSFLQNVKEKLSSYRQNLKDISSYLKYNKLNTTINPNFCHETIYTPASDKRTFQSRQRTKKIPKSLFYKRYITIICIT